MNDLPATADCGVATPAPLTVLQDGSVEPELRQRQTHHADQQHAAPVLPHERRHPRGREINGASNELAIGGNFSAIDPVERQVGAGERLRGPQCDDW